MREIELYQSEEKYSLSYIEDIIALNEKLPKDSLVLAAIKKDYDADNQEFEYEYKKAELAYNINLYNYYHYYVLDFFYRAIEGSLRNYQIGKSDFDILKEKGWLIFDTNFHIMTFDNRTVEQRYQDYFFTSFDNIFARIVIGEKGSPIDNYYKQSIDCFKHRLYFNCSLGLFSIIESLHQSLAKYDGSDFYEIKKNLDKVKDNVKEITQPIKTEVKHFQNLIDQLNDLISNHYFKRSKAIEDEPQIICRNRIAHGILSRDVSEKDCLQLFCVARTLNLLLTLKSADDNMKALEPKVQELSAAFKAIREKNNVENS
ncbi:MAG: hypothetical protein PHY08_09150 [Candidatus Cloacimonetes bacterium]|nr:hypothetical protein [Candidatus Cloacimonadota bacterium]